MTPKQYDRQHLKHLSAMDRRIDQLFDKTLKRLASYGIFLDKPIRDQPFSFADYPDVQQVIDGIFEEFRQSVEVVITKGLAWEDNLSASKATDIASRYGVAVAQQRSQAVAQRKVGGLDLSQRVWNITDTFHKEVETAMDIALRDGTPANRLATDLKQYLKYPDKLFRRVRDEHGQLQLSKRAKEFHPGAGVYRSSYKNARRLAVTETNMAYHKADNERWRQLDFVLGYEVHVSGTNPNVCPICVELAGKYPKEFEFVGWHPHCRCHAVPIMEDVDSFQARQELIANGKQPQAPTGQVTAPPKNFIDHLKDNSDRIQRASKAGTLPYFVRDNYKVGKDGTLTPTFASPKKQSKPAKPAKSVEPVKPVKPAMSSIQERAKARHEARTPKKIARIKQAVIDRRVNRNYGRRILATMDGISDVDTSRLRDLLKRGDHKAILKEACKLRDIGKKITSLKYIDNPLQVARDFSMKEAKLVDMQVAYKIKSLDGLPNQLKLDKLNLEALDAELFKNDRTWSVARDAYKKECAKVEQAIYWDDKKSALSMLECFKTSNKLYKDDLGKLTDAIAKGDKATAESTIARLEKRRTDLFTKNAKADFPPEAYSQERKDKALWCKSAEESERELNPQGESIFKKMDESERSSFYAYTAGSGHINRPLRGYRNSWSDFVGVGKVPLNQENPMAPMRIQKMTEVISRSPIDRDIWVQRGVASDGLKGFLGINSIEEKDLGSLIGTIVEDPAFTSCGAAKGTGFDGHILNIYCPKGSKMLYLDGRSAYTYENEILIQRGTKFRVAKVTRKGSQCFIDLEIVEQI
ncbi:ADP-ribosyltransferase [uncultured Porphyromonas sp.]|uniref:ADP-ribosyltransferase n=1 Tax=uncultured Porphyromonas sp. TaxID=159274 RepID=UPI0026200656|nr:ADP-ribosyltransferase [uncultured Porphyromonas sp.]